MIELNFPDPSSWFVWLDLDDTLWDFSNNSLLALARVYEHFNLYRFWPDKESWFHDYHRINDALWVDLADGKVTQKELRARRFYDTFIMAGVPKDEAEGMNRESDTLYLEWLGQEPGTVPGAVDLLNNLKERGFRTGILSNGFRHVQLLKIKSGGLEQYIDCVVTSDEFEFSKPDRRIFDYAASIANVAPERCIMIGDNGETDIAGAINAAWGMAVWFNPKGKLPGEKLTTAISNGGTLVTVPTLSEIKL